ncbi:MAG: hypothetical protein HY313_09165 [Acidobacteria bacterium]|nr:hypothetical protein [Acidobacteriota bacterium]
MRRRFGILAALLLWLATAVPGTAQVSVPVSAPETAGDGGASLERVIGEVTATDPAAKKIIIKSDAGGTVTVILQEKTVYLRVPPGEKDLKKAAKIVPTEIGSGDRVLARGRLSEDKETMPAVAMIVMTKADLAQKRERERAEWQKRAVAGTIAALNPETKEITLSVRSGGGTKAVVIESVQNLVFRRYAPDSVRFSDAESSSFAALNVGDPLRVLGEKNPDGTRIKPEEIVSGSFRNIAGIVGAIDAAAGEVKITDLQRRKPLTVRITPDTVVRRMPPAKAATPTSRPQAGGGRASGGRPGEGPTQGATGGGGQMDLERMPVVSFGELKPDEAIIVLCTVGAEPSHVTAIVVVAGIEALLGPALQDQTQIGGAWNFFDISVP